MNETSDRALIKDAIHRINEAWLGRRYDEIGDLITEEAVVAPPGSSDRIRGREAYVASYRDYDEAATTHEFSIEDPAVDVVGDVAVAVCPFSVEYELDGTTYREAGRETLVFRRFEDGWKVVWRTMESE